METSRLVQIYKKEGQTPLKALGDYRAERPELEGRSLSYIGRLDPMAEGLLLVLIDGTQSEREQYLGLDKVYRVEILFGAQTDTGDILGKVQGDVAPIEIDEEKLKIALAGEVGVFSKPYPNYSSKPVNGKPLFIWARAGRLSEVQIPTHEVKINSNELIGTRSVRGEELLQEINRRIDTVVGDFRQEEIKTHWQEKLATFPASGFVVFEIIVSCGSGAYMRSLAEDIGKALGVPALAYRIRREVVGGFKLTD
jgi:tRNA pseudouridine55 synthase